MALLVSGCSAGSDDSALPVASAPSDTAQPRWLGCASDPSPGACLLLLAQSAPATEDSVASFFQAVDSDALGPGCYDAAFTLGRKSWVATGAESLAWAGPACETGFAHGLLVEGYTAEGDRLLGRACSEAATQSRYGSAWTESMLLTCTVGAGRALAQAGLSLRDAADRCSIEMPSVNAPFDVSKMAPAFCVRGVVLDYFPATASPAQVVNECVGLEQVFAEACLTLGARNPGSQSSESTRVLASECIDLAGGLRQACFFALADALANRLFFQDAGADPVARRACAREDDCLWHYAKYVMTATWDALATERACELIATPAPKPCVESIPYLEDDLRLDGHIR